MVGEVVDQLDGSGMVELECDGEGQMYLMQLGFEVLLKRGMEAMKKEYKDKIK